MLCSPGPPAPPTMILSVPPAETSIVPTVYPPAPPLVFWLPSAPPPGPKIYAVTDVHPLGIVKDCDAPV